MKWVPIILVAAISLALVTQAHAAPLLFSNPANETLTSPATTFTIDAASVADALTVNATSVVVILSSSTGGNFTLTSALYDLVIASSSSGGTTSLSCNSGTASVTLSQSTGQTTYTISPAGSQCSVPSNSGGGGSSGGVTVGVGSGYGVPNYWITSPAISSTIPSSSVSTASSSSLLLMEINSLKVQLASLLAQAGEARPVSSPGPFTRNLSLGMSGADVKNLQKVLIAQASGPAASKLKAHGTTMTFGILTYNALREFQMKAGIVPASGYFGLKTRAYVGAVSK